MDIGAFFLTIDDGRGHKQLTDQEGWTSTIQRGTTIVMRAMLAQVDAMTPRRYRCPFCDCQNRLEGNHGNSSIDWWVFHGSVPL
jgi:hypothetical protein